jgi:hypothetical protein
MPTIRPITLDCDDQIPAVDVRQQPYPLADDKPTEFWTTYIKFGTYPNEVSIVLESDTPEAGIAMVDELVGVIAQQSGIADMVNRTAEAVG